MIELRGLGRVGHHPTQPCSGCVLASQGAARPGASFPALWIHRVLPRRVPASHANARLSHPVPR